MNSRIVILVFCCLTMVVPQLKAWGNNPSYNLLTPQEEPDVRQTLVDMLERAEVRLKTPGLAGLQLLDVGKLTIAIDTMRKRKEFEISVKRDLTILFRKLKEVETLLANNDLSQEEKKQQSVVVGKEAGALATTAKKNLVSTIEAPEPVIALYKVVIAKMKKEYTDRKVADLKAAAEKAGDDFNEKAGSAVIESSGASTYSGGGIPVMSADDAMKGVTEYETALRAYNFAVMVQILEREVDSSSTRELVIRKLMVGKEQIGTYYRRKVAEKVPEKEMLGVVQKALVELMNKTLDRQNY